MATSEQFVETTTAAALEEKAKLQKHFNRFDIYFFLLCTIVGVDTLGQVAQDGPVLLREHAELFLHSGE